MKGKSRFPRRTKRPTFGNKDWNQEVTAADLLIVEMTVTYHGQLQVRVMNTETGEEKVLIEPPISPFYYN